jgi:hypothetical protein
LENYNITNWYGLTCISGVDSEYEKINFDLTQVKNRVPSKIVNCLIEDK